MPSFEVLLVIGVLGFYVYDSSMLLYINELVFIQRGNQWEFEYPDNNYQLLGKIPYIPNLLTPHNAIFRVYWTDSERMRLESNDMGLSEQFLNALKQLRFMVFALLVLFFVFLPLVLFVYGSGSQLLWIFLLIYIDIFVMLFVVYIKKEIFGISNIKYFILLFESVACAPFALNIVRKLSLYHPLPSDPVEFAKRSFSQKSFYKMIDIICLRISDQLELIEEDTNRFSSLQSYKKKLEGLKS